MTTYQLYIGITVESHWKSSYCWKPTDKGVIHFQKGIHCDNEQKFS